MKRPECGVVASWRRDHKNVQIELCLHKTAFSVVSFQFNPEAKTNVLFPVISIQRLNICITSPEPEALEQKKHQSSSSCASNVMSRINPLSNRISAVHIEFRRLQSWSNYFNQLCHIRGGCTEQLHKINVILREEMSLCSLPGLKNYITLFFPHFRLHDLELSVWFQKCWPSPSTRLRLRTRFSFWGRHPNFWGIRHPKSHLEKDVVFNAIVQCIFCIRKEPFKRCTA